MTKRNIFIVGFAIASMSLITSCNKSDSDDNGEATVTTSPLTEIGIISPVNSDKTKL